MSFVRLIYAPPCHILHEAECCEHSWIIPSDSPPPSSTNTPGREPAGRSHNRGSPPRRQWWQLVKRSEWLTVFRDNFWPLAELVETPRVEGTHSPRPFPPPHNVRCYQSQYSCLSFWAFFFLIKSHFSWSKRWDLYLFFFYADKNVTVLHARVVFHFAVKQLI